MDQQLKDIQDVALDVLKSFVKCCEENGLRYYLVWGSLIGAVRHKGFIPWDDDIDVAMPRDDYERFIHKFSQIMPDYLGLITPENTKHYDVFFSKVYDRRTTYIQRGTKMYSDRWTGVFIDIFPLDGFPDNKKEQIHYIRRYNFCFKMNYKLRFTIAGNQSLKGKVIQAFFLPLKLIFPLNYYYKKYEEMAKSLSFDTSKNIIYPSTIDLNKCILKKSMFGEGRFMEFNGIQVKVPEDYDSLLTSIYGDYMRLPPDNEQIPHHGYDFLDVKLPCIMYFDCIKKK